MKTTPAKWVEWFRSGLFLVGCLGVSTLVVEKFWAPRPLPQATVSPQSLPSDLSPVVEFVDAAFAAEWAKLNLHPVSPAPSLILARRLSLALSGTVPSLQEIRAVEQHAEPERTRWWVDHLLQDQRSSDYLAERLARAYVGTEVGPFLVYRRRRFVAWLSEALHQNRPYDQVARELIDSNGIWTTHPEVNFVTVTIEAKKGPDPVKLAARVTRAFLGVRIDCVQCHDGKMDSPWKQSDFHQLAAFFSQAEMNFAGLNDNLKRDYQFRYLGKSDALKVTPHVPWQSELLPQSGGGRSRLAKWVTDPQNRPFARAMVNRVWAILFNRPLITPLDDIPLNGPFPPGLEMLADDFMAHGYDIHRLIRVIAGTKVFQLDSRATRPGEAITREVEEHWASFPLTRLRPEQMASGVTQTSSLTTVDETTPVLIRLKRIVDQDKFVKRYGDSGQDEFDQQSGTISQRLLLMNGQMVRDYTRYNPVLNASTRVGALALNDSQAVETAYLSIFTRRPTPEESEYFSATIHHKKGAQRSKSMPDLYWALLNSTEFSWNH